MPSDDAWMRDVGPTFVVDGHGNRRGVDWRFNAWGGLYSSWDQDDAVARRVLDHEGDTLLPRSTRARGRLDPRRRRRARC